MRNVNNFDSNLNSMGVEYLQKFTLFFLDHFWSQFYPYPCQMYFVPEYFAPEYHICLCLAQCRVPMGTLLHSPVVPLSQPSPTSVHQSHTSHKLPCSLHKSYSLMLSSYLASKINRLQWCRIPKKGTWQWSCREWCIALWSGGIPSQP